MCFSSMNTKKKSLLVSTPDTIVSIVTAKGRKSLYSIVQKPSGNQHDDTRAVFQQTLRCAFIFCMKDRGCSIEECDGKNHSALSSMKKLTNCK